MPELLAGLVSEIRAYIGSWAQNATLSADATRIPSEFKPAQRGSEGRQRVV